MRRLNSWVMTGILAAACGSALGSDGSTPLIDGLSGQAGLGGSYSGRDQGNARFREYWNGMHSFFAVEPQANIRYEFGGGEVPLYAEGMLNGRSGLAGQSHDGNAGLAVGSYGLFKVRGSFSRIGHEFAHGARSLYGGVGTGDLTLDDKLQQAMWTTSTVDRATILTSYYNNTAVPIDLGFRRDQVRAGVDLAAVEPLSVSVDVAGEQRRGTRPRGAATGGPGSLTEEIPEPIDYDTLNVSGRVGYEDKVRFGTEIPLAADVSAAHSTFQNNISSVIFDNAMVLTDSSTGAGRGRIALSPSNAADSVAANLSTRLPYRLGVSGHASLSRLTQNQELLPATTNALLLPQVTVPRSTAEAKVRNELYAGALTYQPASRLNLKLAYRYRSHRNETADYAPPLLAVSDQSIVASGPAEWVSYIERTAEFEQVFEVTSRTHLTSTFENEHSSFVDGSASRITQNQFKLAVDTRAVDWATVKVSGEHAVRQSDYPDYTAADGELPWMRKFYAADRDRDQVTIITTIAAAEDLDLMIEHVQGLDDYKHSSFGLQKDEHRATTVDLSYDPGDGLSMSTFVSQEAYATRQQSRQWNPNGLGDPYTQSPGIENPGNWTLDSTTVVNTVGMTTAMSLVPDTLTARLEGTASVANGKLEFASPFSSTMSTTSDTNAFLPIDYPKSDETQWVQAGMSFTYMVFKDVAATLGYRYDLWRINDGLRDGYTPVAVTGTGAFNNLLTMDSLFKNYEVHTVYARISSKF